MRLSRWGWSSYETPESLEREAEQLSRHVEVLSTRSDAEILTVNSGTQVDSALLDRAPSARLVLTTTSGYDHIDLHELHRRGIRAGRCPMARRDAVVESALGMLLDGLRSHAPLAAAARDGVWARSQLPTMGMRLLRDATIGVVGHGVIGQRMVHTLSVLGATVLVSDPRASPSPGAAGRVERSDIEVMAERCDAVTLHCRLESGSRRLIGDEWLARARGVVLVNTARGDILDVDAAVAAVQRNTLHYLGCDVFPREPWPRLAASTHPRIVFLPHAAGFHGRLNDAVADELENAVRAFVEGRTVPYPIDLST